MPAPSPHTGPCKHCGSTDDVTGAGRYRGLCGVCRKDPEVTGRTKAAARVAGGDGISPHDTRSSRASLTKACKELTVRASKLEESLDSRRLAQIKARSELALFREALQMVGRVAQSLVNTTAPAPADRDGE